MRRRLDFDAALDSYRLPTADTMPLAGRWATLWGGEAWQAIRSGIVAMPYFMPDRETGEVGKLGPPTLAMVGHTPKLPSGGEPWSFDTACLGWQWLRPSQRKSRDKRHVRGSAALFWGLDSAAAIRDPANAVAVICEGAKDVAALDCAIIDKLGLGDRAFTVGCGGSGASSALSRVEQIFRSAHGRSLPAAVLAMDGGKAGRDAGVKAARAAAAFRIGCRVLVFQQAAGFDPADAHKADAARLADRLGAAIEAKADAGGPPTVAAYDTAADPDCRPLWLEAWAEADAAAQAQRRAAEQRQRQQRRRSGSKPASGGQRRRRDFATDPPSVEELAAAAESLGARQNGRHSTAAEWRGSCFVCGGGTKRLALWSRSDGFGIRCYDCADEGKEAGRRILRTVGQAS